MSRYMRTNDTLFLGGQEQDASVNTVELCRQRCNSPLDDSTCYAFDFNRSKSVSDNKIARLC